MGQVERAKFVGLQSWFTRRRSFELY